MEIERKFLITSPEQLPFDPKEFPSRQIEQGYLCTSPVVRIRRDNDDYFLTYKSKGLMVREEYNLSPYCRSICPFACKGRRPYHHEDKICDPSLENGLTLELDIFHGDLCSTHPCRN